MSRHLVEEGDVTLSLLHPTSRLPTSRGRSGLRPPALLGHNVEGQRMLWEEPRPWDEDVADERVRKQGRRRRKLQVGPVYLKT